MNPKVSIVTVTYNCENEIENTIKSIISQTYSNIEYIIIDGASKDRTLSIINKYKQHITICISEPDKGIFDAMNKAINMATGKWILFMNAGDSFINNDIVKNIFNNFNYDENIGVIFGDAFFVKRGEKKLYKSRPFYSEKIKYKEMGICHQSIFCRTDLAKLIKFDIKYKYAADYNMIMQIYKKGYAFYNLNYPIAIYDLTGLSTNNCISQFKEVAAICEVPQKSFLYISKYANAIKKKLKGLIKRILNK